MADTLNECLLDLINRIDFTGNYALLGIVFVLTITCFFKKSKWYLHFIIDLLVLYVFYAQLQGFLAIHEWASWYAPNNELVAKYNLQYNILLICTVILIVIQIGITIIQKKKNK